MSTEATYIPIPKTITAELVAEIRAVPLCTAIFVSPLCATNAGRSKLKQQLREAGVPEAIVRASGYATASPTPREISPPPAEEIPSRPRRKVEISSGDMGEISVELGDLSDQAETPTDEPEKARRGRRRRRTD